MKKWALCVVALAAGVAAAVPPLVLVPDGPTIQGDDKYASCSLVKLSAKGVPEKASLRWRIIPSEGVQIADTAPDKLQFTAKDGQYRVELLAVEVLDGAPKIWEAVKVVTIGGSGGPGPGPAPDIRAAIGRVRFGNAGCTATVVYPRRADGRWDLVCAAHCVGDVGQTGSITMKDGRVIALVVVAVDRRADLSWFVTQAANLDNLPSAVLAKTTPPVGTPISHSGYGIDQPGNTEHGTVAGPLTASGQLQCDLSVSSGDSGGAIYRRDNQEIVATVCCTTRIGGHARMYGGGSVRAWAMRPKGEVSEILEWQPCPIQLLQPGEIPGQAGH